MTTPLAEPVPDVPGLFWARVRLLEAGGPERLTPSERALYDALGSDRRRQEWLAGRVAARSVARALGLGACSILRGPEGGPRLEGPGAELGEVMITHGAEDAAAVGSRRDAGHPHVGIDRVDARDAARIRRIRDRVLSEEEQRLCGGDDQALMIAWGAREAIAKATRTGMFAFGLSQVRLEALDPAAGKAEVSLPGSIVRYFPTPDGGLLVIAAISAEARAAAQAAAR